MPVRLRQETIIDLEKSLDEALANRRAIAKASSEKEARIMTRSKASTA
jgi:hypothetical protein